MQFPILYSFRRCPYAMRARVAIAYSELQVELREVVLSNKPAKLLSISPKATVPVLLLNDGRVIDESMDIMTWALKQSDPENWLKDKCINQAKKLIEINDGVFKENLDRYKYADRFPEYSESHYRQQGEVFLKLIEKQLKNQLFLISGTPSFVDVAIFPFIRQFAAVDFQWFENSEYQLTNKWLNYWLQSKRFTQIMTKHKPWEENALTELVFVS